jgi:MYXO-CTERM domain-containing protein
MTHTQTKINPVRGTYGERSPRRAADRTLVKSAILASVFAAGVGIQSASAGPVRFDNPAHGEAGHFHWASPQGNNDNWLDITLPASAQPGAGASGLSSLRHEFNAISGFVGDSGANPVNVAVSAYFLESFAAGASISGSLNWNNLGYAAYTGYDSLLPEGTPTYIGVRFDLGGGNQFGWIGVVRTGFELEAFAWGYETEAGVAIAAGAGIPAPGGLALIALGAFARRRRRRN